MKYSPNADLHQLNLFSDEKAECIENMLQPSPALQNDKTADIISFSSFSLAKKAKELSAEKETTKRILSLLEL